MKRLIFYMLSLLGFGAVSCEGLNGGGNLDAYGVPFREYQMSARVVDAEGNPINGIKVSHGVSQDNPKSFEYVTITDSDGFFSGYVDEGSTYLRFEDVDGEANGGEFETKYLKITAEHTMSGHIGDIVLTKKSNQE